MTKIKAIKYLIENDQYQEEWSGAGMWEAVIEVMKSEEKYLTKHFLDTLLKTAEGR